jgi:hypothetical protein
LGCFIFQNTRVQPEKTPNVPAPSAQPEQPKTGAPKQAKLKTASGEQTRAKMANVQPSPEMTDKLSRMDLNAPDEISDQQAADNAGLGDEEPGTEVGFQQKVGTAVSTDTGIEPEWHMVKHLPGYLASGIRSMGRAVFAPFTNTPIENIQVVANVGGTGPNSNEEVNAVGSYLVQHGQRNTEAELEFRDHIPDYTAKLKVYTALGHTFMLVKDFGGNYIYSWPTSDEKALPNHQAKIG